MTGVQTCALPIYTKELETSIVPIGDGVALSVKKAQGIKEAALNEED